MSESNATQVILTDDGIKIIKAQNTADNATGGVANLNDPNLMSVIEKQNNIGQFAGLTSQYNVLIQNAKDDGIDTTAVATAYNNLNRFMADILVDPNHASDVDRVTYKKYQDAYNQELSNLQSALQNNVNNKFISAANATSQAASTASQAFSTADSTASQAQLIGSQADSAIAVQSQATAKAQSAADNAFSKAQEVGSQASAEISSNSMATVKAQSTADNAFSQATTAIDNGKVTSQAVTDLKDGSKLTIAELENGLATKVSNSDYASYKEQTASQIASKVDNGAFSAYQQTTADLISSKVATKDFSAYQATTAKSIESKVESSDFNTYKTQTADLISSKVSSIDFNNLGGGRNYLLDSKLITITPTGQANYDYRIYLSDDFWKNPDRLIANNIKVSFTMHVKNALSTEFNSNVYFGNSPWYANPISYPAGTTKLQKYKLTYSITDSAYTANNLFIRFQDTNTADNPFIIENVILSIGSNFVDWSPAPEDQATQSQITQLSGEIEQKVDNGDFSTYKTQTDKLIGSKVDNGDFSTYQKQTADLISAKVSTKDFSAYQDTTAKAISSKVESSDFNTYKTQTDSAINDKVSSAKYTSDKTQTDNAILSKVSKKDANNVNLIPYSAMPKAKNLQWTEIGGGGTLSAPTHAFYHSGVDSLYELNTAGSNEVFAISPRFKIKANTTYTFQLKGFASSNVSSMDVYVIGRKNGETKDYTVIQEIITGTKLSKSGLDYRTVTFTTGAIDEAYIRVDNNGSADGKMSILGFTELKLEPGDTATPYVYGAEDSMISQMSDDINLRVTKDSLLDQINLQAGKTLISSSGQLTLSGKNIYFDSTNPVIIPSANIGTALVNKKLTAADISANTFTTNNGTFTVKQDGSITAKNMTLTGGTLTSPTINASTINGSTINGTTFNAGDIINNANNTAKYYPMTITPDGAYKSTYFDSAVGLQSSVESGGISYKYRSMIGSNGQYLAYDSVINGQGFESHSGYTSAKDTTFSNTETITGYVNVTPSTGIYLYGPTQKINFAGNADNIGSDGITMDAYGNIYAQANSAYWRIRDINGHEVANFGIDTANQMDISLYRDTQVGNLFLGVGHTIGMLDKQPLYFKQGDSNGNMLDIKAGAVYYTSLVKSSLLSVKKDVKKVDTAYWAQLVNSIDLATYQYKSDDNTSHIRLSSIVDDVNDTKQWQLPDVFISRDENGKLSGVDDSVLLNATLATVQEQQKEIDQLNGHLLELEAKLNG